MNKIKYLFSVLVVALIFSACTDELEPQTTPYVSFTKSSENLGMLAGQEMTIETKVYAVNTSGSDRTYGVVLDKTATTLDESKYTYSLPSEVVIPSGSNEGVIKMTVKNLNLGYGEKLPLTIYLKGDDENFTKGKLTFNLYSICESYDLNALNGKTLTGKDDWTTPNTENITVKIKDGKMFLGGIGHGYLATNGTYNLTPTEKYDVPVELDPKTGNFTFKLSKTGLAGGAYEAYVQGRGQYIPCAKTITLSYKLYLLFKGDIVHIGNFIPKGAEEDTDFTLNVVVKE